MQGSGPVKVGLVLFENSSGSGGGRQGPGRPSGAEGSSLGQAGLPGHARPKDCERGPDPDVGAPQEAVCVAQSLHDLRWSPWTKRGFHHPRGPARGQSKKGPGGS